MTKLVFCNGRILEVYEVGKGPIHRFEATTAPIKPHGWRFIEDHHQLAELIRLLQESRACRCVS